MNSAPPTQLPQIAGRSPPHSVEAEEYLLSCCFLDGSDSIARCLEHRLPSAAFYAPANRVIYECLCELYASNTVAGVEVVIQELQDMKLLEAVGGVHYVMQVSGRVPTTAQVGYFIEKVQELWHLRELIKMGAGLVEQCFAYKGGGLTELLTNTEREFMRILTRGTPSSATWEATINEAEQEFLRMMGRPAGTLAADEISWGFSDFDYFFQPLVRKEFAILGARPSIGKSSLARAIAYAVARAGIPVQFFSLEVSAQRIANNLASAISGVGRTALRRNPSDGDRAAFAATLAALKHLPNWSVDDQRGISSLDIISKLRIKAAKKKLGLVVIDYLQLLADWRASRYAGLAAEASQITKRFHDAADEFDCVILAIAQINRLQERERNRPPVMSDLRDSSSIEADADRVDLMHRPDVNQSTELPQYYAATLEDCPSFYVEIIQAKGRDVGTGCVGLDFERSVARFRQLARKTKEAPASAPPAMASTPPADSQEPNPF